MEKVKRDQTVGLLALLAALVALAVFSASSPVMADYQAEQNATVAKATTINICAWDNTSAVNYWNFTGIVGGNNNTPVNSNTTPEQQAPGEADKPVARLVNSNPSLNFIIYLNAGTFSNNVVDYEYFNTSDIGSTNGSTWVQFAAWDTDTSTGDTILQSDKKNLWLNVTFGKSGVGTSTFKVLGEKT